MPILNLVWHVLPELFGKTDNWWQIYKQAKSTFYSSNKVCLKNNVLGRKIINCDVSL